MSIFEGTFPGRLSFPPDFLLPVQVWLVELDSDLLEDISPGYKTKGCWA